MDSLEAVDMIVFNSGDRAHEFGECCYCGAEIAPEVVATNGHWIGIYPFSCHKCGHNFKIIAAAEDVLNER